MTVFGEIWLMLLLGRTAGQRPYWRPVSFPPSRLRPQQSHRGLPPAHPDRTRSAWLRSPGPPPG